MRRMEPRVIGRISGRRGRSSDPIAAFAADPFREPPEPDGDEDHADEDVRREDEDQDEDRD